MKQQLTTGEEIFKILNNWVYNDMNTAGDQLSIIDGHDFPKIMEEIESVLLKQKESKELFGANELTAIRMEKPTDLQKILAAVNFIRYAATNINTVHKQIESFPPLKHKEVFKDMAFARKNQMENTVGLLSEIMENLGDLMNNQDMVSDKDIEVTSKWFDIVNFKTQ
jgi:hypothetical protein